MLTLITQLATALRLYLQIKLQAAAYDLTLRITRDHLEIEQSIQSLRDRGDPASQLLADQLRKRSVAALGVASAVDADLPAAGAEDLRGAGDIDARRPLPPAGG